MLYQYYLSKNILLFICGALYLETPIYLIRDIMLIISSKKHASNIRLPVQIVAAREPLDNGGYPWLYNDYVISRRPSGS